MADPEQKPVGQSIENSAQKGPQELARICLRSLAGEETHIEVPKGIKILDLKAEIGKCKSIPVAFQDLVAGTRMLGDAEVLADCGLAGEDVVSLLVLVSMAKISEKLQILSDPRAPPSSKHPILRDVGRLGPKYAGEVVETLCKLLESPSECLRCSACSTLAQMANQGDEETIGVIAGYMCQSSTRQLATRIMSQIVKVGNEHVIGAMEFIVRQGDSESCLAALEILGLAASGTGDRAAIDAIGDCLEDADCDIRAAAVLGLNQVIRKGDERGMDVAKARFNHPVREVRWAAREALGRHCDRTD